MKRIVFIVVSIMCLYASAQNTFSIQSVGANSVTINYSIVEDATLYIYENDTVYYEDFSLFPEITNEAYNNFLWSLPDSYLKTKGAKGQKILKSGNEFILATNLIGFVTGSIDISKALCSDGGINNGKYTCAVKVNATKRMRIKV